MAFLDPQVKLLLLLLRILNLGFQSLLGGQVHVLYCFGRSIHVGLRSCYNFILLFLIIIILHAIFLGPDGGSYDKLLVQFGRILEERVGLQLLPI